MADEQNSAPAEGARYPQAGGGFTVTGQVSQIDENPRDLELKAYVYDPAGRFLGAADVDERGSYKAGIRLAQPSPVEVIVGPPDDPQAIRRSCLRWSCGSGCGLPEKSRRSSLPDHRQWLRGLSTNGRTAA